MLTAVEVLHWIEQTWLSDLIRQSAWAVMALEAVHLLGLALLGGAAVITGVAALRGGGLRGIAVATFAKELRPFALTGLILMAGSGSLIALSMPLKYYDNPAFRCKMLLLACALVASAILARLCTDRSVRPAGATAQRVLALLALLLWIGVGFSGRLIGFL
jgi:hypothetical protein